MPRPVLCVMAIGRAKGLLARHECNQNNGLRGRHGVEALLLAILASQTEIFRIFARFTLVPMVVPPLYPYGGYVIIGLSPMRAHDKETR